MNWKSGETGRKDIPEKHEKGVEVRTGAGNQEVVMGGRKGLSGLREAGVAQRLGPGVDTRTSDSTCARCRARLPRQGPRPAVS